MLISPARKILAAIDRRLRRARPGSVLIIVIVLLLLLAVLGTAFITTSRDDRVASAQNQLNTLTDVQLQGLADAVMGVISDDLNDPLNNLRHPLALVGNPPANPTFYNCTYRGQWAPAANTAYYPGDVVNDPTSLNTFYVWVNAPIAPNTVPPVGGVDEGPGFAGLPNSAAAIGGGPNPPCLAWEQTTHVPGVTAYGVQSWLTDRIPLLNTGTNAPYWSNISQIVTTTVPLSVLGLPFESPDGTAIPPPANTAVYYQSLLQANPQFQNTANNALPIPALYFSNTGIPPNTQWPLAASASGDGIADSLMFRVPGAHYDGLTWYAAVRVIDNNSAINVNTAWSSEQDYDARATTFGNTLPNWGFFQSGVGLQEFLNTNDLNGSPSNFVTFNQYRLNDTAHNPPIVSTTPFDETYIIPPNPVNPPRTDYNFLTFQDALHSQLIRRLNNSGFATDVLRFQAVPLSDQADLAYAFSLGNPTETVPDTILTTKLSSMNSQSLPYTGTQVNANDQHGWFNQNFNFPAPGAGTDALPRRAVTVAHNPVSNYITPLFDPTSANIITGVGEPLNASMLPYGMGLNPAHTALYNHYRGQWLAANTPYAINDIVLFSPTNGLTGVPAPAKPGYTFICTFSNSNQPASDTGVNAGWELQPFTVNPVKANVNTASFRELFRAFWCVMAGNPPNTTPWGDNSDTQTFYTNYQPYTPNGNSATATNIQNPQHMFRSTLRDPTSSSNANYFDPENMMQLRAAIAAVNTMGLRDSSQNITSRDITLEARIINGSINTQANGLTPVHVSVFSEAPQPFITEIYVDNDNKTPAPGPAGLPNPMGYVAIELYNPYQVPLVLNNWKVGYINRANPGTYPDITITQGPAGSVIGTMTQLNADALSTAPPAVVPAAGTVVIPAGGYALLENYNANPIPLPTANDALFRSRGSLLPTTGLYNGTPNFTTKNTVDVYVPNLSDLITGAPGTGGEFVLIRPRQADGNPTASTAVDNFFDERPTNPNYLNDLVPVDQYDFTGIVQAATPEFTAWSYIRPKGTVAGVSELFRATYPGFYNASTNPRFGNSTSVALFAKSGGINLGGGIPAFSQPSKGTDTYNNYPPIDVYNVGGSPTTGASHFPNPVVVPVMANFPLSYAVTYQNRATAPPANPNLFPFGGFARNGDMLDILYIGSYRVCQQSSFGTFSDQQFVELNSLPMDCAFADAQDGNTAEQNEENIGRFCPITARPIVTPVVPAIPEYYAWSRNLFNYLTVESNSDDYMPNVDSSETDQYQFLAKDPNFTNVGKYPPLGANNPPTPVHNDNGAVEDQTNQDNVGVEGLININTASAKVLSALPFVTPQEDGANSNADNWAIAQAIVAYRNANGPFTSIFDLNKVIVNQPAGTTFQNGNGHVNILAATSNDGLISPPDPNFPAMSGSASGLAEDFRSDFAVLNRVSNMITTHSDTFTVYVVLEGWQNAVLPGVKGTAAAPTVPPILVSTRRYAYIADRSAINNDPATHYVRTTRVPAP